MEPFAWKTAYSCTNADTTSFSCANMTAAARPFVVLQSIAILAMLFFVMVRISLPFIVPSVVGVALAVLLRIASYHTDMREVQADHFVRLA